VDAVVVIALSEACDKALLALLLGSKGTEALLVLVVLVGASVLAQGKLDGRVVCVHAPAHDALGVDGGGDCANGVGESPDAPFSWSLSMAFRWRACFEPALLLLPAARFSM